MTHVTNKVREIVKKLKKEGFGGISFEEIYVQKVWERDDFDTQEEYQARLQNYGSFIANPRFPTFDIEENFYVEEPSVNTSQFYQDLIAYVKGEAGEGVKVRYREGCHEFECQRVK